jgi:hypothetical protein
MTAAQKQDGRLLIQGVFSGIPCFGMMTFHHLIRLPLMEILSGDWCFLNGPLAYLWFNKEVRSDWLEFVGLKSARKKINITAYIKYKFSRKTNVVNDNFKVAAEAVQACANTHLPNKY